MPSSIEQFGPFHPGQDTSEVRPAIDSVNLHGDILISPEWRGSDDDERITQELQSYDRSAVWGLLAKGPFKRIVGALVLLCASTAALAKGYGHGTVEKPAKPHQYGSTDQTKSHTSHYGGGETKPRGSSSHAVHESHTVTTATTDFSHATHAHKFGGNETVPDSNDTARISQKIARELKVLDIQGPGITVSENVKVIATGHASPEHGNEIPRTHAQGLNDRLEDTRVHDVAKIVSDQFPVQMEFGPSEDVRVPHADGSVDHMTFDQYLAQQKLTAQKFNELAKIHNHGRKLPAEYAGISDFLKENRGVEVKIEETQTIKYDYEIGGKPEPKLKLKHPPQPSIKPVPIAHESPVFQQENYIPPIPRFNERDENDKAAEDTEPLITLPPDPPPPPPRRQPILRPIHIPAEEHSSSGRANVRESGRHAHQGGVRSVGDNIPKQKNWVAPKFGAEASVSGFIRHVGQDYKNTVTQWVMERAHKRGITLKHRALLAEVEDVIKKLPEYKKYIQALSGQQTKT